MNPRYADAQTFCNLNFDRLLKVDIKEFESIPAVDRALPAAGFGAGTYDAKDDDTYESGEVEVARTNASVRDLGFWALTLRCRRSTCTLIPQPKKMTLTSRSVVTLTKSVVRLCVRFSCGQGRSGPQICECGWDFSFV